MDSILREELTFTTTVKVPRQYVHDLLVSAFEGGCNYWLKIRADDIHEESLKLDGELNVENQILKGGKMICYDIETDEKLGELTALKIVEALNAMGMGKDLKGKENEHLKKHFKDFIDETGDAITADVVVQIAVMGELVFG